jgi:hypothetical protein
MNNFKILFLLFSSCFLSTNALAQCCAAGTPNCDNSLGNGSGKKVLALSIANQYSYSDQYYQGSEAFHSNYLKNSYFHFGSVRASYGVSENLKLVLDMGYFFSKAQTLERNDYFREAKGMSDVGLSAVYKIYDKNNFQFSPIFRLTFPIGQFDQKYGPVILPIDLQPSAGSLKSSAGMFGAYKVSDKWSVSLLGTYEISNKIKTEFTSYQYGGLTNVRLMANYNISEDLTAGLHTWYQDRARALDENEELINATGGQLMFLCPTISYSYKTWKLGTRYEVPVYKNMNGTQLTNKHRFALRLTKSFDFNKDVVTDTLLLSVNGICGMCKTRIEAVALNTPEVFFAEWNMGLKQLEVKVGSDFNKELLIKNLIVAGHDTEGLNASAEAYDALHECCKYRE